MLCVRGDGSVCLFWKMLCVLSELKCLSSLFCLLEWMVVSLREGGSVTVSMFGMVCECMVPLVGQL